MQLEVNVESVMVYHVYYVSSAGQVTDRHETMLGS